MIIKKENLKKHFSKASKTYDENASVQIYMGKKLLDSLSCNKYENILEIGCGSGIFSESVISKFRPQHCVLNDISEDMIAVCKKRFNSNHNLEYLTGDIEKIRLNQKYSLIISNACLQWLTDLKGSLKRFTAALEDEGVIAFTSFGSQNVKEISSLTHNGLCYLEKSQLDSILSSLGYEYSLEEEVLKVHYDNALTMLRTLKNTGVTGFTKKVWTRGMLQNFIENYEASFTDEKGVFLTWHLYYVLIRKKAKV